MTAVYETTSVMDKKPVHPDDDDQQMVLLPRGVKFDWTGLPTHYMKDEPFVTHFANLLHLLLPAGEAFFIDAIKEALPYIKDDKLWNDVQGFIGQETIHYTSHQEVLDYFSAKGFDTTPYTDHIEYALERILGKRPHWSLRAQRRWMLDRIGIVAAIEHYTAILGKWVLNAHELDHIADPRMLDMLRWHGAEEVEHHAVAFDVMKHLGAGYFRQARTQLLFGPFLLIYWIRGIKFMYSIDPALKGIKPRWRDYRSAYRRGLLPSPWPLLKATFQYYRPSFHPHELGGMDQAIEYLAKSPAARAAH